MREQIIRCDGYNCQKIKGEANHWFGFKLFVDGPAKNFRILQFESIKDDGGWEHFCGEECLLKMVARNLPK